MKFKHNDLVIHEPSSVPADYTFCKIISFDYERNKYKCLYLGHSETMNRRRTFAIYFCKESELLLKNEDDFVFSKKVSLDDSTFNEDDYPWYDVEERTFVLIKDDRPFITKTIRINTRNCDEYFCHLDCIIDSIASKLSKRNYKIALLECFTAGFLNATLSQRDLIKRNIVSPTIIMSNESMLKELNRYEKVGEHHDINTEAITEIHHDLKKKSSADICIVIGNERVIDWKNDYGLIDKITRVNFVISIFDNVVVDDIEVAYGEPARISSISLLTSFILHTLEQHLD